MTGDGKWCEYIDQCAINNGGCDEMVTCTNTNPGRKCGQCPSGYQGNGVYCKKSSLCDGNNGGCSSFATCAEENGQPKCTCLPGYSGNGIGSDGCKQTETACDLNCNNGVCAVQNGKAKCLCYQGWGGDLCDKSNDPCLTVKCKNGGTCHSEGGLMTCLCTPDYTGTMCEQEIGLCGGEQSGEKGSVTYPGSGNMYPNNAKCAWTVVGKMGNVIEVTFTMFDLESKTGSTCHDKLEVLDHLELATPTSLFTGCGKTIPKVPKSETNSVEIHFTSDARTQGQGFSLDWTAKEAECGGRVKTPTGTIQSPGYPTNHPINKQCKWFITVDTLKIVEITFDEFEMRDSAQCVDDYLALYNGIEDTSTLLPRTCGKKTISKQRSKGPYVTVDFITSDKGNYKGFKLSYISLDNPDLCGGDFDAISEPTGIISSPGFPTSYKNNENCVFNVIAKEGANLMWTFSEISLEKDSNCYFDHVDIGYGTEIRNGQIHVKYEKFCGFYLNNTDDDLCIMNDCQPLPLPIYTHENELSIKFTTDISGTPGRGFSGTYELGCGGRVTTDGLIQSPYYPDAFPVAKKCTYNIQAEYHQFIKIHFNAFSLDSKTECLSYIALYDGLEEDPERMIFQGCGTSPPDDYHSTGSEMLLIFNSDGSSEEHGFEAMVTFETLLCGSFYDASQDEFGFVTSPGYPLPYPKDLECIYYISAEEGFVIQLDFIKFDIEQSTDCTWDYVALYDSSSPSNDTLLGQYCGKAPPGTIYSSSNALTIEFITDSTGVYDGWEAKYQQKPADDVCGGFIGGYGGVVESNMYPNAYPSNQDCKWEISMNTGVLVELEFLAFDIEYSRDCKERILF